MRSAGLRLGTLLVAGGLLAAGGAAAPAALGASGGAAALSQLVVSSVSFVSPELGWALGSRPCGTVSCPEVARTRDGGRSWGLVGAPRVASSVDGLSSVQWIYFANSRDGWAFGWQLWSTRDGGSRWARVPGFGSDQAAAQAVGSAGGTGYVVLFDHSDPATGVRIASSRLGSKRWRRSPTELPLGAGPVPWAQLVVEGSSGWVLQQNEPLVAGARLSGGSWTSWTPPCAAAGGPVSLAAASSTDLAVACVAPSRASPPSTEGSLWISDDAGASFSMLSEPAPGLINGFDAGALAEPRPTVLITGSAADIYASFDGGTSWSTAYSGNLQSVTDFDFPTPNFGVAIDAGTLLRTVDGGHHWTRLPL